MGGPDGKNPLGRRMRGWKNNSKMDFQEVGWGGMDWTDVAQDRDRWRALVNAEMNLRVPQSAGNIFTSFAGRTLLHGVIQSVSQSVNHLINPISRSCMQSTSSNILQIKTVYIISRLFVWQHLKKGVRIFLIA